jgi:hypothetical protein
MRSVLQLDGDITTYISPAALADAALRAAHQHRLEVMMVELQALRATVEQALRLLTFLSFFPGLLALGLAICSQVAADPRLEVLISALHAALGSALAVRLRDRLPRWGFRLMMRLSLRLVFWRLRSSEAEEPGR